MTNMHTMEMAPVADRFIYQFRYMESRWVTCDEAMYQKLIGNWAYELRKIGIVEGGTSRGTV